MKEYESKDIRNVVLVSHGGTGKTSFAECLLHTAKATPRLGKVDDGTSILDYADDEIARKITINLTVAHLDWKDVRVNIIDTPGYADFYGDTRAGVRVADSALVIARADGGVEVGTEKVWDFLDEYSLPRMIVVTRMDKEYADFDKVVEDARTVFDAPVVAVQLPVGKGDTFSGVVDLLQMKYFKYDRSGSGAGVMQEVPADLAAKAKQAREKLVESIAECSDELLESYLEGKDIKPDALAAAYRDGFRRARIIPVVCVSSAFNVGSQQVLEAAVSLFPNPEEMGEYTAKSVQSGQDIKRKRSKSEPFAALVFKTISEPHVGDMSIMRAYSGMLLAGSETFNATKGNSEKVTQLYTLMGRERREVNRLVAGDIAATVKLRDTSTNNTMCDKANQVILEPVKFPNPVAKEALRAKVKGEEDKMSSGLSRLLQEDPTVHVGYDAETKETIISGLGELHLDVLLGRLKSRFNVDVELAKPRIPYRETVKGKSEHQGKYKKQTGGRGQYGDCWLRLEPLPRATGFEFVDDVVGGVVPNKFIPAVEKGVREAMEDGVLAGYKVVDLRVSIYDGSYHDVDSSDMAFKIAGSMAFKKCFTDAKPVLLEPLMTVTVIVPEDNLGDVMGDLSGKRGKILGIDSSGRSQVVKAMVPLAEMYKYSTTLRSMTQGRGSYAIEFSHYEEVPRETAQKIIDEANPQKDEAKK